MRFPPPCMETRLFPSSDKLMFMLTASPISTNSFMEKLPVLMRFVSSSRSVRVVSRKETKRTRSRAWSFNWGAELRKT